jgi:hypothetical protein
MEIAPTPAEVSFDAETIRAMGEAFDDACHSLQEFGTRVTVREIISRRIVEAAKNGLHNRARLYEHALLAFDVSVLVVSEGQDFPVAAHALVTQKA